MTQALEVQDSTFQLEVLESKAPVLVDFWAPWCGPCRAMAPAVDQLAGDMGEKLKVVKHNTQDHADIPGQLGIMAIPAFLLFKDGVEVARHVGQMSYDDLKGLVEPHLD